MVGKENAGDWIKKNKLENGKFKVYYTEDAIKMDAPNSSFSVMTDISEFPKELEDGVFYSFEDTGLGLRYDWEYVNGKQHGRARSWFSNGQLRVECTYNMGELIGNYIEHFEDGQLREKLFYNNGNIEGLRIQYYKEGKEDNIKWEKYYVDGNPKGIVNFYYKDGVVRMEGQYKNNQPEGEWTYNHTHDNFKTLTPYVGKVFNGQEEDGNYLLWSEEEEDWIKNRGWERMERKCDSWISIENGKIIEKVKFEDIGFDGRQ
jgi:antitoxin component YwqK of YwqJK toxin-antitoxin module